MQKERNIAKKEKWRQLVDLWDIEYQQAKSKQRKPHWLKPKFKPEPELLHPKKNEIEVETDEDVDASDEDSDGDDKKI